MTKSDAIKALIEELVPSQNFDEPVRATPIYTTAASRGVKHALLHKTLITQSNRVGRGLYNLGDAYKAACAGDFDLPQGKSAAKPKPRAPKVQPFIPQQVDADPSSQMKLTLSSSVNEDVHIPSVDPTYIAWGEHKNIKAILSSGMFFPVYISGLSGNGKTMMVEQIAASLKREYIRVQISPETDEDDLIGGFRLKDGETVFHKGPVVKAMERGAILLIDEVDRATNKILCLQGVLEGKPILIKKIGEVVHPRPGFNVIATANTKGRGSDDGRYSGASIIDDAFLERFVSAIDQPYPSAAIERKIVERHMSLYDSTDNDFADKLVAWSSIIRKTYENEGVDELVSTRRLCHIVKAYSIFADRLTAIRMCISRFDIETRDAFLDLYTKVDAGEITADSQPENQTNDQAEEPCPF